MQELSRRIQDWTDPRTRASQRAPLARRAAVAALAGSLLVFGACSASPRYPAARAASSTRLTAASGRGLAAGAAPAEARVPGASVGGVPPIAVEPGTGGTGVATGAIVTPEDPGPANLVLEVDATRERNPISPYIYGTNQPDWTGKARFLTLARAGGNRWTTFNWENNASNAGSDYRHQNDGYLGASDTPGETPRALTAAAHAAGASMLLQIPIAGHVAADKRPEGDVAGSRGYLHARFRRTVARKNGTFAYPPDPDDDAVYQDELVHWLEGQFPEARTDERRTLFYALDNEPDLWADTHARIHPQKVTYAELAAKNVEYARAIKDVAPAALVFGSVNYGWQGFVNLQDAPDAGGRGFLDYYLDAMRQAEQQQGRRLVDVLDVHWYPEATGGGVRIIGDEAGAAVAEARVQAPRSLWDPTYVEDSWVAGSAGGPIRLLGRLKDTIAAHYPGTRLAISEYSFGAGGDISGGLAQADALGAFGREGVFAATLWHMGSSDQRFAYAGFAMYRNLDGQGAAFGDLSVHAQTSSLDASSLYASVDSADPNRMVVLAINKSPSAQTAALRITADRQFRTGQVYRLTSAAAAPVRDDDLALTHRNSARLSLPPRSVTALVLGP